MDLGVILGCMMIAGASAYFFMQGTKLPTEARITIHLASVGLGGAVGYLLLYLGKGKPTELPATADRPVRRQVAGNNCAKCGEYLLLASDGHFCPTCDQVYCKKCVPAVPCEKCVVVDAPAKQDA